MPTLQSLCNAILLPIGLWCVTSSPLAAEDHHDEAIPTYYFSLPLNEVMLMLTKERGNECNPKLRSRLASFLIPAPKQPATANYDGYSNSLLARRYGPIDINGNRTRNSAADFYCVTFPAARATQNGPGCAAMQTAGNETVRFCGSGEPHGHKAARGYEPGTPPVAGFRGSYGAYGFNTVCDDSDSDECKSHKNRSLLKGLIHQIDPEVIIGY